MDESQDISKARPRKEIYGLADEDGAGREHREPPSPGGRTPSGDRTGVPLAPEDWKPVLDESGQMVCPDCGAPLPGENEILCLRCGFDLANNRRVTTRTGEVVVDETGRPVGSKDEEPPPPPKPISPPGRGGMPLPAVVAGCCVLIMTIAFLMGSKGLFESSEGYYLNANHAQYTRDKDRFTEPAPLMTHRVGKMMRYYLFTLIVGGSTLAGVTVIARLDKRPLGDVNLALVRSLAVVSLCGIALLINLGEGWGFAETLLQLILMGGIFMVGARGLFALSFREAGVLGGIALGLFLTLIGLAKMLAWVVP